MYQASSAWSEGDQATLRELWAEGLSASQIARKLTVKRSRNAVIGKIHRLGIAGRVSPNRPCRSIPPRRTRPRIAFVPNSVLKPVRMKLGDSALAELRDLEPVCFDTGPRTIETVRDGECRFMADDGPDAPLCGRRAAGAWCALHTKLVYQPSRKRKQEDASIARVTRWLDRKSTQQDLAA